MWKVVIADDEYLVCEFLKKIINWEKINLECVGEASNGIQAFQLIQQLSPDIVIADVRMPGLSGLELIERCCQAGIICSFIIISGYPDFEYAKTAFTRGAVNYILKPIDEIELENTLLQVCKNIEKQKEPAHENAQTVKRRDSQIHAIDYEKQEALRRLFTRQEASLSLEKLNQQYGCCFDRELSFNVAVSNVSVQETDQETDTFLANVNARIEEQFRRHIMPLCQECQGVAEQGQLVFLLNYQPSLQQRLGKEIAEIIEKIQRNIEPADARITMGLGRGKGDSFPLLYQEAVHALGCRYGDSRPVIMDGDVSYVIFDIYEILNIEWENRFLNLIDVGNEEELKHLIENVQKEISARGHVDPNIYLQAFQICTSVFGQEAKRLFRQVFDQEKYSKMARDICVHSRNLQELFRGLVRVTIEVYHECIGKVRLKERWPVIKAKQYIEEHYSEKIVLKNLADQLFVNADYLSSVFKKDVGVGFNDYLRQYRMTIAQQLIRSGECSIEQAAEKVGYLDPKHFSKSFKKTLGVSPAEYRKFYRKL